MPDATAAGTLDVTEPLARERERLIALLADLPAEDWSRPTECPAWTIKGIALHILGDDLSLLSRQRDAAQPSVFRTDVGEWAGSYESLDEFNEAWVEHANFFSPQLIVALLESTGAWTLDWYTTVDPESLGGEAVWFYSEDPAPYWMISAREYWERWIHQNQIRRAAMLPLLDDDEFLMPAMATVARAFPHSFRLLPAPDGTAISVTVDDLAAWTVRRDEDRWRLYDGPTPDAAVGLSASREAAALLFSRGLTAEQIGRELQVTGDDAMGSLIVAGFGTALGRTDR